MKRIVGMFGVLCLMALFSSDAGAQLRGLGRIAGKVTDEGGSPLGGVSIKASLEGASGAIDASSDDAGAWAVNGMGKGEWDVTFEKGGYAPRKAKVTLPVELARVPPIMVAMRKAS
jgi:hypothetical protein